MKKTGFIIILILILSVSAGAQSLGDVNNSSQVDIVDSLLVAQYYVGLNPAGFYISAADVSGDSTIDIIDALLIAQYYVGLISEFPAGGTVQPTQAPTPQAILLSRETWQGNSRKRANSDKA